MTFSLDTLMMVLDYASMVVGVFVVLCLIYEKFWAWPLGVLFCFLSGPVLWHQNLYSYLTLTVIGFLPMNLYGWYYWLFGTEQKADLKVIRASPWMLIVLAIVCVLAVFALPSVFPLIVDDYLESAEYMYLDNSILVLSLCAMWMTARKMIENWIVWFIVNVGSVTLFALLDLWGLMTLYVLYIGMAVWGYKMWHTSLVEQEHQVIST